jgi:LemA protein
MSPTEIAACVLAAVVAFWMLGAYNRLVRLRQAIAQTFGQFEIEFTERDRWIPRLIEQAGARLGDGEQAMAALEAAARQARAALEHAAAKPGSAGRVASLALAEQVLRDALHPLAERLDALHGDPPARETLEALALTQSRLSVARQNFNQAVLSYNAGVRQFPTRLIAGLLGFRASGAF